MTNRVLSASLFFAPFVAACAGAPPPPAAATAVRVSAVARAAPDATGRYSASINPASRVDLAFKVGGYVAEVARVHGVDGKPRLLQAGDHVKRGQALASVKKSDYEQKLAEATAAREQSKNDFDRASRLAGSQSIARADHDTARVRLDAAEARWQGAGVRVQEAENALADTTIRAPMDGVVLARTVELGTLAGPGTVAFAIADTRSVKVVFGVPDTVLEQLHVGAEQIVTTETLRGRDLPGRITRVSPVADPKSRVFEVEVTLPNDANELKPGMVASLKLGKAAAAPLAVLPLSAVVRSQAHPGHFAVFVVEEGGARAHQREVELGDFLGNVIPVKEGLKDGEKVVVMGASLLSDGERVQVIP